MEKKGTRQWGIAKRELSQGGRVVLGVCGLLPSVTEAQTTTRVRVAAEGLQANGKSGDEAALSMDGRRLCGVYVWRHQTGA